jgi:hypothetical protein
MQLRSASGDAGSSFAPKSERTQVILGLIPFPEIEHCFFGYIVYINIRFAAAFHGFPLPPSLASFYFGG